MEQQDCLFPLDPECNVTLPEPKKQNPHENRREYERRMKRMKQNAKKAGLESWVYSAHQYKFDTWARQPRNAAPTTKRAEVKKLLAKQDEKTLSNAELNTRYTSKYPAIDRGGNCYHWEDRDHLLLCDGLLKDWHENFLMPLSHQKAIPHVTQYEYWSWMLFSEGPFAFRTCIDVTGFDAPDWLQDMQELFAKAVEMKLIPDWLEKLFYLEESDLGAALRALQEYDLHKRNTHPVVAEESVAA